MTVHVFGAVSSPAVCNFALQQLIVDAPEEYRSIASRIKSDFYVDNLLTSFDSVNEAAVVCDGLVKLLSSGGFPLVQFSSSDRCLLENVPVDIRAVPELNLDLDKLPVGRTLGYLWNCQIDSMVFQFKQLEAATDHFSCGIQHIRSGRPAVACGVGGQDPTSGHLALKGGLGRPS